MIASSRNAGARKTRAHSTPVVTPVARAIRAALAASAVIALSTGVVQARVRAPDAHAVACRTVDVAIAPGSSSPPPVDLTRVACDTPPASVLASNVDAAWGSDIATLSAFDVGTDIHVSGYGANVHGLYAVDDSVTVVNTADITADAAAAYAGQYTSSVGVRAMGTAVDVHNDVGGLMGASAHSDGGMARARGVYATGMFDHVTVDNDGDIQSTARADGGRADAHGIYAFGYGSATTVDNAGDIDVDAQAGGGFGYATGITSIGYGSGDHDATVSNSGSIHANADAAYAYAFGAFNLTRQSQGDAHFSNDGDIHAKAVGDLATATGVLNLALRYGDAVTTNTGTVDAVAIGTLGGVATGLYSYANVYNASLDNDGDVGATAAGGIAIAHGIEVSSSLHGSTTVTNNGEVSAQADATTRFAEAAGLLAASEVSVDVTNTGGIDVVARSANDVAFAIGMYGTAVETTTLRNYGDIGVLADSAYGDAIAYGIHEFGGYAGIGLVINGGTVSAAASAGAGMQAHATGINAIADVASVFNDRHVDATATAGDGGLADARAARAYGMYAAVSSYGELAANASADGGVAQARGAEALGQLGATVYNAGDIVANAESAGGEATAAGAYTVGVTFGATTTNHGSITAHASGDAADVYGVLNASAYYGDAITTNTGSISAVAEGGIAAEGEAEAIAFGVYNFALLYDAVVDNSGSIYAAASAMADIGGTTGFLQAKAIGAEALSAYGYGDAVISNTGDIGAVASASQGYASAWGAAVQSTGVYGGSALIDNAGSIAARSSVDIGVASATGAYALDMKADTHVVNHGDITATARSERGIVNVSVNYAYATGVKDISLYGAASLDNFGNITAIASSEGAITGAMGVQVSGATATVNNAAGAKITAVGEVDLFGGGFATGIQVAATYGVDVANDGDIIVYGHAHAHSEGEFGFYGASQATGISAEAGFQGDVLVTNNGDITAVALSENSISFAQGGAGAVGINAYAKYDATVVNAGDILATATSEFGIAGAYGAITHGKYTSHFVNDATIYASASVGSVASDLNGGRAVAFGSHMFGAGMAYGLAENAGTIVAHATSTAGGGKNEEPGMASAWGSAIGAYSDVQAGAVVNAGDIEAAASAEFGYATAFGTYVLTQNASSTTNTGRVRSSATANNGVALAVGSYAYASHATVTYDCDENGCDYANPHVVVDAGASDVTNGGDITATARAAGGIGHAYGVVAIGAFGAAVSNTGTITVASDADDSRAVGIVANSFHGNATVDNEGQVLSGANGMQATAIGVLMGDAGHNVLSNTGTIGAFGDGERIAVSSGDGAMASIANGGTMIGALRTGALDDGVDNAAGATWHAVGESTFGDGDDHIANHGTIVLDNAAIRLGGFVAGNTFGNFGTLVVSGDANVLDMDNPFPVVNDGAISFVDGAADDMLTIVGDFAGDGAIRLDASGLQGNADRLYIDGNVVATATQTLDVNLVDSPTSATVDIPLVQVAGDSLSGNFALGTVHYAGDGFLSMDFRLNSRIDANNAARDIVSLGVDVTGLNGMGSVAAAIAPGVQRLVDAQVGTWRQRMGVVPRESGKTGLAPWVRAFSGSGDAELDHVGNFGAPGQFGFDQSTHGWELGLDARPVEHFAVGVLFADVDATQHLDDGTGSDRFDGKTFGVYGTWFGDKGLYVDASVRWTGLDARLRAAAAEHHVEASAASFNVEAGFTAWTTANGLNVVPQAQYTRTRIADITPIEARQSTFVGEGGVSSRGRLGVAFDQSFEHAGFTWTPYGSINAMHEFDGEYGYAVDGGLLGTTRAEGTSGMIELGVSARKGALSITGGFDWTDGGAMQGVGGGQLVVRYSW
jgi:outer membrane autotransporter protein